MKKNKNIVWYIIGGIITIILIVILISSNNQAPEDNVYICDDGTRTTDKSSCLKKQIETIVSVRTKEQYEGLRDGFPSEPEISACNYDFSKKHSEGPSCELISTEKTPNDDYVFTCECSWYEK